MPKLKPKSKTPKPAPEGRRLMHPWLDAGAAAVIQCHNAYMERNDPELKARAVNYAFLAGKHYFEIVNVGGAVKIDENYALKESGGSRLALSFDKIGDEYANVLGTYREAVPRVGIVRRIGGAVNDTAAKTHQDIMDYHVERVWRLEKALSMSIMPNAYPGGSCFGYVYQKLLGGGRTVTDLKGNIIRDAVANDDGSVRMPGRNVPADAKAAPQKLEEQDPARIERTVTADQLESEGLKIEEVKDYIVDIGFKSVFDVSVHGKFETSLAECLFVIDHDVMTLSELRGRFEKNEEALAKLKELEGKLTRIQSDPPMTGYDSYMSLVGLDTDRPRRLTGDDRMLHVWVKYHNPTGERPSGRVEFVAGLDESKAYMLYDGELDWGLTRIQWEIVPIDAIPYGRAIKKSPLEAMIGAQVGRDRIMNARILTEAYNADPPEMWVDGLEFSVEGSEWKKLIDYPQPGQRITIKGISEALRNLPPGTPIRFTREAAQQSTVEAFLAQLGEQFRNASHHRTLDSGTTPRNIPGVSVETQYAIDKMDLGPSLMMFQDAIFTLIEIAWHAMKRVYRPDQRFRYSGGKTGIEDLVWMQEKVGDELDLLLKSRIGQPLTKESKIRDIRLKIELAKAADEAGVSLEEIYRAMNMDDFAYGFTQEDPDYENAKYRLLLILKGKKLPNLEDIGNLPIYAGVIGAEINSKRYGDYPEAIRKALMKELASIALLQKQKDMIQSAAAAPEAPEAPGPGMQAPPSPPAAPGARPPAQ